MICSPLRARTSTLTDASPSHMSANNLTTSIKFITLCGLVLKTWLNIVARTFHIFFVGCLLRTALCLQGSSRSEILEGHPINPSCTTQGYFADLFSPMSYLRTIVCFGNLWWQDRMLVFLISGPMQNRMLVFYPTLCRFTPSLDLEITGTRDHRHGENNTWSRVCRVDTWEATLLFLAHLALLPKHHVPNLHSTLSATLQFNSNNAYWNNCPWIVETAVWQVSSEVAPTKKNVLHLNLKRSCFRSSMISFCLVSSIRSVNGSLRRQRQRMFFQL